jgi:hypothetical protein
MSTNGAVINLADLCQKWADGVAARYKTKVKYIDLFAQREGANQKYKLSCKLNAIDYGTAITKKLADSFAFQSYASNDSPNPSTAVLAKEWQTQSNFTWSLKETLKVSAKETLKGEVSLPLLANGEAQTEIGVEFDVESQQQWSTTATEKWTVQETVTLAANRQTVYTWIINREEIDCPFTIAVNLTGNIAVWFDDKIDLNHPGGGNRHWLWYPGIQLIASELRDPNLTLAANGANLVTHGTFSGIGATTNYVDIKTYPLGTIAPGTRVAVGRGDDLNEAHGHKALSGERVTISQRGAQLPALVNVPNAPDEAEVALGNIVESGE